MEGLYDILQAYEDKQNRLNYEGLYDQEADTSINLDPMYNIGSRQFGPMIRGSYGVPTMPKATGIMQQTGGVPFGTDVDMQQGFTNDTPGTNFEFLQSAYEDSDEDAETYENLSNNNQGILSTLKSYLPFIGDKSISGALLRGLLPKEDPRSTGIRNFYGNNFGLDNIGRVGSGIMAGYNPVSGFGSGRKYGLTSGIQNRIESILGRKMPQTNFSRSRVEELRDLQLREMRDRIDRGESAGDIGREAFSGSGQSFEKQPGGSVNKGTKDERNYGGR